MEIWLRCEELMRVKGWKTRTVQAKAQSGELPSRDGDGRHPNGKPIREYLSVLSAAQEIVAKGFVARRGRVCKATRTAKEADSAQLTLFSQKPQKLSPVRKPMNKEQDAQVDSRHRYIAPLLEAESEPKDQRFPRLLEDGTRVRNWGELENWCAARSGQIGPKSLSVRTVQRLRADVTKKGYGALLRDERKDKGKSRFFSAYPKAAWLVGYLFLDCRQSCRVAHEAIVRDAALIEVPSEELPSYETVRAWLKSMPPSLVAYAREGRKAYRERMAPYLKRGFTDVYANAVWVGDCMIHDVECSNDCFEDAEWGAPIRLRLDAMLDYRSRMFVGQSWCWEGSSRSIAATMRRAVATYGPCECWYVDNGKPYQKVAKGARPGYLMGSPLAPKDWRKEELDSIESTGFLARLGIAATHCQPFHPQAKCIERAFRTLHERFDRVWPTYTSGDPFTRHGSTEKLMMQHRRLFRAGRVSESKHPLASHFILACLAWMEEYADTPHAGEGMDGCTPRQVFEANRNPDQKSAPDYATLSLLMAERETRRVRECAVTVQKHRYQPIDQAGWATLHQMNECEVIVAYDPADLYNVAAYDSGGNFLAWLEIEQLARFAPGDPATQAQIAESMTIRHRLEKGTREAIALVSRAARANGAQSPLEAMDTRLQLPADTAGIVTQRRPRLGPEGDEPENTLVPGDAGRKLAARKLAARTTPPTPAEAARMFLEKCKPGYADAGKEPSAPGEEATHKRERLEAAG